MTTFEIDTGADRRVAIPDWFVDTYQTPPEESRLIHDYAYHLIGEMNGDNPANAKTMRTIRKHALMNWGFLRALADEHPDVFDEFWTAYAERALS